MLAGIETTERFGATKPPHGSSANSIVGYLCLASNPGGLSVDAQSRALSWANPNLAHNLYIEAV
jgi:hypothetical protein